MLVRFEEQSGDQWKLRVLSIILPACIGYRWAMDMLTKYGSYKTVWERHKKWSVKGAWKIIMNFLVSHRYSSGSTKINDHSVDCSTIASRKGATNRL